MIFTAKDLSAIKRRTSINYHLENYLFIAKKIHSKLLKDWKKLYSDWDKLGYLDEDLNRRYNYLREMLMSELDEKSPEDYVNVNKVL